MVNNCCNQSLLVGFPPSKRCRISTVFPESLESRGGGESGQIGAANELKLTAHCIAVDT